MEKVSGRKSEIALLERLKDSLDPELLAVYGRRRIGKTFLIRQVFQNHLLFEMSGIHQAPLNEQLRNFQESAKQITGYSTGEAPLTWLDAFTRLKKALEPIISKSKNKQVLFFDEFPWIETHKSGFLRNFSHFWNTWASLQPQLVVVICGSAASWIIKNVIGNRGGLHNRITKRLRLLPFTLHDTEQFLIKRNVPLDRYQIILIYMVMGGVPAYLAQILPGESANQAIARICFSNDGMLRGEFYNLYGSLFEQADRHVEIVKGLAKNRQGQTRNEIADHAKIRSGGTLTGLLCDLIESGFLQEQLAYGRTQKDAIFRLSDEYSLFFLKYIDGRHHTPTDWLRLAESTTWKSWTGFAFEAVCLNHIYSIKIDLGIADVATHEAAWRFTGNGDNKGAQIDLLIDRADHTVNVCEMKFSPYVYSLDKKTAENLTHKLRTLKQQTKTRKTLFLTLITPFGVKKNEYYTGLVQRELTLESLFHLRPM